MKLFAQFVLCLLLSTSLVAQNPLYKYISPEEARVLQRRLAHEQNDTLKLVILKDLSYYYQVVNQDTSNLYAKQELKIAEKLQFEMWQAQALWFIGFSSYYMGNTPEAYQAYKRAITILQNPRCEQNIWGLRHLTNTNNPKYARLSLLANTMHDDYGIYLKSNKPPLNYKNALQMAREINDTTTISIALMNLGGFYAQNKVMLDSSFIYSNEALYYAKKAKLTSYLELICYNLAVAYQTKKDTNTAIVYLRKSLNTGGVKNSYTNTWANHLMVEILRDRNQIDSSLFYAHQALERAKLGNALVETMVSYRYLADLYHRKGNLKAAFEYSQKSRILSDSLQKYRVNKLEKYLSDSFNEQLNLKEAESERLQTISNLKTYGFTFGILIFITFGIIQFRSRKKIEKANLLLRQQRTEIEHQKLQVEKALSELRSTQAQLIQKEKLASLGELTAGIAHEIQNPLNFVNNFSELSVELLQELSDEIKAPIGGLGAELLADISQNLAKINLHGKRASSIVKGMLEHSHTSTGIKELTDINKLADEYLRLSYHGLRAKDSSFNCDYELIADNNLPKIEVVPQEIGRVLLNLLNNAFYAVNERTKQGEANYQPKVTVTTKVADNQLQIRVTDNGLGIPDAIKDKIFQPFFTTKPTGEGTGLGLSLAYDIVTKGHSGAMEVESVMGEGTTFVVKLPT
jgi:two-component system, NtrC family, sensor kinase